MVGGVLAIGDLGGGGGHVTWLKLGSGYQVTDAGVSGGGGGCAQLTALNLGSCKQVTCQRWGRGVRS